MGDVAVQMANGFGRILRVILKAVLAAVMVAPSVSASAQVLAQAKDPCPEAPSPDPELAAKLRELALKPGGRIDPATFLADPRTAEFIRKMTAQEQARIQRDWAGLCRYRAANSAQKAKARPRVVFLGDSITENWIHAEPSRFSDKVIDRGISGQTSGQILLRFYPDVVALRPKTVHILAGTNDILRDNGTVGDDDIVNNIRAMIDIAQANRIKVVLGAILPISVRAWQPDLKPAQRLIRLNERLESLAKARKVAFIDYFSALKDADDGLRTDLGNDGVHPNRDGYSVMRPMAERALGRMAP